MTDTFSTLSEKQGKIIDRKSGYAISLSFGVHPSKIIRDAVCTGHIITDGQIIEDGCLTLSLERIQVCHVECDVWQQKVHNLRLKILVMVDVNAHRKRRSRKAFSVRNVGTEFRTDVVERIRRQLVRT